MWKGIPNTNQANITQSLVVNVPWKDLGGKKTF
jgi:hypothetical protein